VQVWSPSPAPQFQKAITLLSGLDESVRYLEFYHRYARPMLSSNFDNNFWSRTTLQMAFSEPAVRHALIALGYLHSTESGTMRHARSRFTSGHESKTLLYHYNKSIRGLVERMEESDYTPEIGLVTCLLFVCMEFLRGNYHTAFTHLRNGLGIISEHQKPRRHDSITSSPSSTDLTPTTTISRTSTLIEDELKPIFVRAMTCGMLYGAKLDEATYVSEPDLQHYQSLHFNNIREIQLSAYELRNQCIVRIHAIGQARVRHQVKIFSAEDVDKQQLVLACQRAWLAALEHYRNTHKLTEADELVISSLMIHYYPTYIWLTCYMEPSLMALDAYLDDMKTILRHCKHILDAMDLDAPQPAAKFTFEMSVIIALYNVACGCRCPVTRREAVTLLERGPPREGLWDVWTHVVVSKRLIELEEEEVDERGWPVEQTRFWNVVIDANMDQKGGFWVYFMPGEEVKKTVEQGKPQHKAEFFHV
jgi:hypothetical protein